MEYLTKLNLLCIGIILLISVHSYPQTANYFELPYTTTDSAKSVFVTAALTNGLLMVHRDNGNLISRMSTNNGATWGAPNKIDTSFSVSSNIDFITGLSVPSGRIIIGYKKSATLVSIVYSDNNGINWSGPANLPLPGNNITKQRIKGQLSSIGGDSVVFTFIHQGYINYIKSTDKGLSWSSTTQLPFEQNYNITDVHLLSTTNSDWILCGSSQNSGKDEIFFSQSTNSGTDWSSIRKYAVENLSARRPMLFRDTSQSLLMIYERDNSGFGGITNTDIVYRKSTDLGNNWSDAVSITKFIGKDRNFMVDSKNNQLYLSFLSERHKTGEIRKRYYTAYTGIIGSSTDNLCYPMVSGLSFSFSDTNYFRIKQTVYASFPVTSNIVWLSFDDTVFIPLKMYDDGTHGDSIAGDNQFSTVLNGLLIPLKIMSFNMTYRSTVTDSANNTIVTGDTMLVVTNPDNISSTKIVNMNAIELPMNSQGVLADVIVGSNMPGGKYLNKTVLFSAGFFLSGKNGDTIWSSGNMTASRINDFVPGKVDKSINNIFLVKITDAPFSTSWKLWQVAVTAGAKFYDGDGDGKYIPVDKNKNGRWDLNEDRPDLIGDFTYYTVFNDAVSAANRRYTDVKPQGIEIRQTIFGWGPPIRKELNNSIFVRYEIVNRNPLIPFHDSVYFSLASDPDLGDYQDDLVGCDTLLNAGYVYNAGADVHFGATPPALFVKYIYGPQYSEADVTYRDINRNGKYDDGIDSAYSTSILKHGKIMGEEIKRGYSTRMMTSFTQYMASHPTHGDPNTKIEARNLMLGAMGKYGSRINVCTWIFGNGAMLSNCGLIDNNYMYSGSPDLSRGWLNTNAQDQRMLVNSGPFQLEYNKPVEVLMCYTIGQGNSAINSVTVGKEYLRYIDSLAAGNFSDAPGENIENEPVVEYASNYPNPFNPSTTISFTLGSRGDVTVKIYDVLGREIKTLVNEIRERGLHQVQFNGAGLSSGVYFYEIKTAQRRIINKMILVK